MTDASRSGAIEPADLAIVAGQLGRWPRDLTGIAARCPFGRPAVIETAPLLAGSTPNPTLLYLTCPALTTAVSRAEAAGAVRAFKSCCRDDERLLGVLQEITRLYRSRRASLAGGEAGFFSLDPRPDAGIGGPESPELASCLHAYAAALLAVMSGWLGTSSEDEGGTLGSEARGVWTRFLPPVEESWCRDHTCARWGAVERGAAIDVGTISVRLLVADVTGDRPRTLLRLAEVTWLGQGLRPGGRLGEGARRRTGETVARYVEAARRQGAGKIVLAGTSAAREAADGDTFIRTLGRDHGVETLVLSGEDEARLAFAGASMDVGGDAVVLDVGGGSTELVRRAYGGAVETVSLELGASRATELWIRSDPPSRAEIDRVRAAAGRMFADLHESFGAKGVAGAATPHLVGVAGTVTTLACLDARLTRYDAEVIHLRTLSVETVRDLAGRLSAMTTAERAALPCVQAGRAPVIVAGAVIVLVAMEALGYDRLIVSERDLLDGLVLRGAC